ncbi:MAG: RNA polymerase sigma factor [Phycisphaerales bacterium]|nr:MAG: RNA polymerase sigma factor [Phycisphaerales bacterium]
MAGGLLDELYRRAVVRFCRAYLGSSEEAEDAAQEVFYRVLRATEVPDNFRAWLYRIARNYCTSVLRKRARRRDQRDIPEASHVAQEATGYLTRVVKQELQSRVVHLIEALPQTQRESIFLRYGEELSRSEIAYVLDIPESTVKSRLFQGLKKLREHTSLLGEH